VVVSKLINLLTGGGTSLIDKAVEVADKFIETPEEKKAFIEKAYEQEVEDRRAARDLGKNKATPDILTYVTLVIALGLATAIFTDFLDWKNLTEWVQAIRLKT